VNVLLLPRECLIISLFDKKIFKRKNRRRNNQSNTRGIASSGQDVTYEIIPKETEAIKHAIKFAEEGFITCLSDVVINAIEIVQEYLDREMNMVSFNFFMHIKLETVAFFLKA
jgi:cyanophycin synthetase